MDNLSEDSKYNTEETEHNTQKPESFFKKPVFIGKVGRLPKKLQTNISNSAKDTQPKQIETDIQENNPPTAVEASSQSPIQQLTEKSIPLPYKEPAWSGLPESKEKDYLLEVLKNGAIIETVNLMNKPFWLFGRLPNCDICMQHPTISRYHAVLQYRQEASDINEPGFYIYDLESTHGTFLNKNRLKSKVFVRVQVGHMLKLGCSSRSYILNGPEYDAEEESELSVTELKRKREEEIKIREAEIIRKQEELEEKKKKEEERGVDWGLGEDADEETDLSENPFAQTNNEELYLDDPKKALRGFFEREGLDLEYDCNEQGIGQFLCRVELPVDDEMGRPIVAEVLHKGKKKESVIQCALEACRILDRYGVLRQATHESRKRKTKNWEENDYYDSDEDTFLDRTGTIEKKREKRMSTKAPQKVETYESLIEKERTLSNKISQIERDLANYEKNNINDDKNDEEDSLDTFMKDLSDSKMDKTIMSKLKLELTNLRIEQSKIIKLINIVKPTNLPSLVPQQNTTSSIGKNKSALPMFGKRKKIEVKYVDKSNYGDSTETIEDDEEEIENLDTSKVVERIQNTPVSGSVSHYDDFLENLSKILNNLEEIREKCVGTDVDSKILYEMEKKVIKQILDLKNIIHLKKLDTKRNHVITTDLNRIFTELKLVYEQNERDLSNIQEMKRDLMDILEAFNKHNKNTNKIEVRLASTDKSEISTERFTNEITNKKDYSSSATDRLSDKEDDQNTGTSDDKKKKRNQRRIQQRQGKLEQEKQKGYDEDAAKEDYNMWVPPTNQTGDGRTNLNDKFGY